MYYSYKKKIRCLDEILYCCFFIEVVYINEKGVFMLFLGDSSFMYRKDDVVELFLEKCWSLVLVGRS